MGLFRRSSAQDTTSAKKPSSSSTTSPRSKQEAEKHTNGDYEERMSGEDTEEILVIPKIAVVGSNKMDVFSVIEMLKYGLLDKRLTSAPNTQLPKTLTGSWVYKRRAKKMQIEICPDLNFTKGADSGKDKTTKQTSLAFDDQKWRGLWSECDGAIVCLDVLEKSSLQYAFKLVSFIPETTHVMFVTFHVDECNTQNPAQISRSDLVKYVDFVSECHNDMPGKATFIDSGNDQVVFLKCVDEWMSLPYLAARQRVLENMLARAKAEHYEQYLKVETLHSKHRQASNLSFISNNPVDIPVGKTVGHVRESPSFNRELVIEFIQNSSTTLQENNSEKKEVKEESVHNTLQAEIKCENKDKTPEIDKQAEECKESEKEVRKEDVFLQLDDFFGAELPNNTNNESNLEKDKSTENNSQPVEETKTTSTIENNEKKEPCESVVESFFDNEKNIEENKDDKDTDEKPANTENNPEPISPKENKQPLQEESFLHSLESVSTGSVKRRKRRNIN